jgi:trehalose 2-sulfotransferase
MTIKLAYWICTTPRTGGQLLGQLLRATGLAGRPEEYFWPENEPVYQQLWQVSSYPDYLRHALTAGTTPNGVFGAKMDASVALSHFERQLRSLAPFSEPSRTFHSILTSLFPNLQFIWLTRRNKVRQAVSWWKAMQSNEWARTKGDRTTPEQPLHYNFAAIDHLVNESLLREAAWQTYFSEWRVRPLALVYEDFTEDYAEAVARVLDFLGVREPYVLPEEAITLVKQADTVSEEWVQRYREEKQRNWTTRAW